MGFGQNGGIYHHSVSRPVRPKRLSFTRSVKRKNGPCRYIQGHGPQRHAGGERPARNSSHSETRAPTNAATGCVSEFHRTCPRESGDLSTRPEPQLERTKHMDAPMFGIGVSYARPICAKVFGVECRQAGSPHVTQAPVKPWNCKPAIVRGSGTLICLGANLRRWRNGGDTASAAKAAAHIFIR